MTKRLTIALIAVALFVLMAIMPVSAITPNGTVINQYATVFIGEQGLDLTHALNGANQSIVSMTASAGSMDAVPSNMSIGWWASAADVSKTAYSARVDLSGSYTSATIDQASYVGYTGAWYLLGNDKATPVFSDNPGTKPIVVFNVVDPKLEVAVWDYNQLTEVTGKSVPQGEQLGVSVKTNMVFDTTDAKRSDRINQQMNGWKTSAAGVAGNATQTLRGAASNVYIDNSAALLGVANNGWSNASTALDVGIVTYTNYSFNFTPTYTWADVKNMTVKRVYSYNTTTFNPAEEVGYAGHNFTIGSTIVKAVGATDIVDYSPFTANGVNGVNLNAATDGYINIKMKDESGATMTRIFNQAGTTYSTSNAFINTQPYYFPTTAYGAGTYWKTDALDTSGQFAYPVGTYSIWAESGLNKMKDNYKNAGADYTGKTVSAVGTVTLVSDTVKIEANKDSVVRSKTFSVTVTGKPSTTYYVWVKNTNAMSGGYDDQPPAIAENQEKVYFDDAVMASQNLAAGLRIGSYQYENSGPATIRSNVAKNLTTINTYNQTRYYGLINTSTSGVRTVEFTTTNWTKAQKYTIRVEQHMPPTTSGYGAAYADPGAFKSDEVDINVEKGAVTIVAAGDQSYYLGEEIKFSGTNTETYKTYLFLIGPNLYQYGAQISNQDPRNANVENGDATTFKVVDVNGDNTWSWKWGTASYALDAGTYTIYAVSQPSDKQATHLANAAYGTVSVIIKKPFVSATASQSTVARGDKVFITGTAEGDPSSVAIWIMGKNFAKQYTESVNSDSSFSYEIKQEVTKDLTSGQYFVVVQHPMQNKVFDVALGTGTVAGVDYTQYVVNKLLMTQGTTTPTTIFKLLGSSSLQGSDAAEALAEGINNANVDDTYTKLQFLVEEPTIRIDPIGDKHVGDKFTITAQTNLAVDDEILVQVYSSSFKPTQKSQSGEFSGATGTVKVTKGDSGMNKISFDVDSSTFKPDEYIVTEDAVLQTATGTALFNVLETSAKTVAPTAVVTAAPTAAQTSAPTAVQTTAPVATTTKASPGFGALIALIGLGAVAFVVVRRH